MQCYAASSFLNRRATVRKLLSLMIALALGLALLPGLASAQTGSYRTTFQIRNLSTTAQANVQVKFINQDGTVATTFSGPIPPGGSVNFFELTAAEAGSGWSGSPLGAIPAGFNGSVEILSDQPIVAVTNILQISGGAIRLGESYNGFNAGDTNFILPVLMRNNSGFNTWFSVQNTGASAAQVTINYTPAPGSGNGTAATEGPVTIPSGAARTFRQDTNANLSGGDPNGVFIGLAKVTSTQPVVVVVNQENAGSGQMLTYNGIGQSGAAPTLIAPLIQSNNGGFFTSIAVTNVGTATTNVTITYSPNVATGSGVCGTPNPFTVNNLAPNVGTNIIQIAGTPFSDPQFAGCRYIGSATITSSNGQNLVAVVNQLSVSSKNASSYEAFNPATATSKVIAPIAQSGTAFSSLQVYNAGTSPVSGVTITFSPNTTNEPNACPNPSVVTLPNIDAGASVTSIQLAGNFEGADPQFNGCRYVGSATVQGPPGSKLLAVVNQLAFTPGDALFSYNGFNE